MPYALVAMSRRRLDRAVRCLVIALATSGVGCGSGDDDVSDKDLFGDTAKTRTPSRSSALMGRFDAGDHKLYLECTGKGSPTVVYLHSAVQRAGDPGHEQAGRVPSLLDDRYRVCAYDRANVGRSDRVPGRLTGEDSVRDLHALLGSAGVKGPFVLLGPTTGGTISDLYAARYPKDVAGMVLLASALPAYLEIGAGPPPGTWRTETEHLDRLATLRQAGRVQGQGRRIPVTYMAAAASIPQRVEAGMRRAQRAFVARFSPGRLIVVTGVPVPHAMAEAIPDRVAREVEQVIAAARQR
jgi:pimeloyl-ACP methyl ester carboxylesterase